MAGDVSTAPEAGQAKAPATQPELAYWCLRHPAPGMQICSVFIPGGDALAADGTTGCLTLTWPYAPLYLGVGGTEEVLATSGGEVADRHLPTCPTTDEACVDYPGREACGS